MLFWESTLDRIAYAVKSDGRSQDLTITKAPDSRDPEEIARLFGCGKANDVGRCDLKICRANFAIFQGQLKNFLKRPRLALVADGAFNFKLDGRTYKWKRSTYPDECVNDTALPN